MSTDFIPPDGRSEMSAACRRGRITRRTVAAFGACVLATVLPGLPGAPAVADEPAPGERPCPVLAVARGVQVTVSQEGNAALSSPTGIGVPVARSCVDYGVKDSQAFASSPYPGEMARTAPGLLGGQLGVPLPEYPAYAGSRHPAKREAKVERPGMALLAKSSETASDASATSSVDPAGGTGTVRATAASSVDPAAETSKASAKATVQPLTIGGVLKLGELVSTASARLTENGTVERSSRLLIGRTTVAGQEVAIASKGIRAAGQSVSTPDTTPVRQALAEAGVTVRYLAEEKTKQGVTSAGLEIALRGEDPESGAATTYRFLLGRSVAGVAPVEAGLGDIGGVPGTPAAPAGGTGGDVSPAAAGAGLDEPPAAAPGAELPAPAGARPPPVGTPPTGEQAVALRGRPGDLGIGAVYLVIVLGAVAMFAGGTIVRLLGVKTRWTS